MYGALLLDLVQLKRDQKPNELNLYAGNLYKSSMQVGDSLFLNFNAGRDLNKKCPSAIV